MASVSPAAARHPFDFEPRIDGMEKVTGAAVYAADVTRPGMLWARVLRSPVPHARIRHIDTSGALALPGVRLVLTGADLPDVRVGRSMRDMPVLAREKVRFIGEKVAAVAADDPETAEEALTRIEVDYDELPAVFDPLEAMQPGAPLVHDPADARARKTPKQVVAAYPNSVSAPVWGASPEEMEQAFARAAHVFEHTFHTPIQHQGYIEPHACTVELDAGGVAHIWASNKAPFLLLDYLRLGLGLQREQVQIHLLPLGGDFGGKGSFMDIPLAYYLAKESGRPVRLVMSYTEELIAGNPRHSAVITVQSGFDLDGRLVARRTRSVYNSGAYAAFKPALDATLPGIRGGSLGAYEIPVWRVEGHMVYTNTVPCGHMRAPGEAQPIHAIECHMDLCARAMGMDPLELRLINAPSRRPTGAQGDGATGGGQSPPLPLGEADAAPTRVRGEGVTPSPPRAREALRAAADAIGWDQPKPPGVGRGIALVEIGNSLGDYAAWMTVDRSGQVVLHTPIIENGAGMLTVFRQMLAEGLGLPLTQVSIDQTLEGIEFDRGVGGSRITRMVGRMIDVLAERMRSRLAELVAAEFGHRADQIALELGGFRTPEGRFLTVAEAAALAPTDVEESLRYEGGPADVIEVYAAIASEVSVDRETGEVQVHRVVNAQEVGRVVNSLMHQGQIDGGLTQGLGYALMEGLTVDEGKVTMANLNEYKMPTAADVPPLETILLSPDLSLGITPIGEGPNAAMSACLANAVADALERQVDIPVSAEAVSGG